MGKSALNSVKTPAHMTISFLSGKFRFKETKNQKPETI